MVTKEEIKAVLAQSFERLLETLDYIDAGAEIYPSWTVKEVIAHLIGWDRVTSDSLSSFIQGGTPVRVAINGVDAFNQESIDIYRALSLEESVKEWEKERQRLLDTLIALEVPQLEAKIAFPWGGQDTISKMLFFLSNHDTHHTNDIITIIQS
jgi:uncharacterized damage-inducible protein DinB